MAKEEKKYKKSSSYSRTHQTVLTPQTNAKLEHYCNKTKQSYSSTISVILDHYFKKYKITD